MKDLTQGNIYKTYFLFALPLMLAGLLAQAYSIVDTMIAGRFLGETGLAAIGATSELLTLVSSAVWGLMAGLGMRTAALFGAKDYPRLKNSLLATFLLLLGCILLISVGLLLFREPIFDFLRVDARVRDEAAKYYTVYLLGFALIVMNDFGLCTLNALGMSGYPFKMSLLSMVLNVGGNLLAVTVLDLGVTGLAIASVTAALVVDILYFCKIRRLLAEMKVLHGVPFSFTKEDLSRSLVYALPTGAQQGVMYISSFLILPIINGIGGAATAAYVVIMKMFGIVAAIYENSSKTISNYVAQSVGAGKYHLLPRSIRVGLLQAITLASPFVLFIAIFPYETAGIFFPVGFTGEAVDYAVLFARTCLPFILFNVVNNLFHSYFRGLAAGGLLLVSTAIGSVSRLVFTYLTIGHGFRAVFYGFIGGWLTEAVFCAALYFFFLRKRKFTKAPL